MENKKVIVGVAALVVAAVLVGVGVFAAFTDTESTSVDAETGALDIEGADDITIEDLAPGDIALRDLSVTLPEANNDGDLIQSIRVSVPAVDPADNQVGTPSDQGDADDPAVTEGESLLDGDNGLQVLLASCSGDWTLPGAGAQLEGIDPATGLDASAECDGDITITQTEVGLDELVGVDTFEFDAADFGLAPTADGTIPGGSELNLIAQLRLPEEADNAYEDASLTFDFLFEAIQRAGVNR